jgi:uncharacterized protein YyaL (SSP411 family)
MQSPAGGFFSAEDADSLYRSTDSEKREGAFYVWTMKEFQAVLGDRDAGILAKYYNVQENGNVEPENGELRHCGSSVSVSEFSIFPSHSCHLGINVREIRLDESCTSFRLDTELMTAQTRTTN